jgi:hypothetical protein
VTVGDFSLSPLAVSHLVAGPYDLVQSVKKATRSSRVAGWIGILRGIHSVDLHADVWDVILYFNTIETGTQ